MANAMTLDQVRQNFLNVADLRSQNLPRQSLVSGVSDYEFVLPKAGYPNYLIIDFQGSLVITGAGGTLAISSKAPYNVFSKVAFEDYLGNTRVSCSGWRLYEREISTKYAYDSGNAVDSQAYSAAMQEISIGGGGGAAGTYPLQTSVVVPIALHHNTTKGTFPGAVAKGQNTVTVSLNSLTGSNIDALLVQTVAGFTVSLTGTIGITYYYWDVPVGTPLPTADFGLVHELREIKETDNIAANSEKTFALPTGRTYYQLIQDVVLNDAMDTNDVDRIKFLIDGDTPRLDELRFAYLTRVRRTYGRDFPVGMFLHDFWRKPWTPEKYGSLQTSILIDSGATIGTYFYTSVLLESLYQANNVVTAG